MTKQEFIQQADVLYGIGRYGYVNIPENVKTFSALTIHCNKHNVTFNVFASDFLNKRTKSMCSECVREMKEEQFINRCKEKYGDYYDYSLVHYTKCYEKVTIICPVHGKFEVKPRDFVCERSHGCVECYKETCRKQEEEKFLKICK